MLVLICCKSCPKKENNATVNDVYFPSFPYAQQGTILFVDLHGKRVTTNQSEIVNVVIPFWYWKMICDYVEGTESAVQSLTSTTEE